MCEIDELFSEMKSNDDPLRIINDVRDYKFSDIMNMDDYTGSQRDS